MHDLFLLSSHLSNTKYIVVKRSVVLTETIFSTLYKQRKKKIEINAKHRLLEVFY